MYTQKGWPAPAQKRKEYSLEIWIFISLYIYSNSTMPHGSGFDSLHFTERLWQVQVLRMESLVHCKILCNCAHHTQVEISQSVSETRITEYEAISQSLYDGNCALVSQN